MVACCSKDRSIPAKGHVLSLREHTGAGVQCYGAEQKFPEELL